MGFRARKLGGIPADPGLGGALSEVPASPSGGSSIPDVAMLIPNLRTQHRDEGPTQKATGCLGERGKQSSPPG